MVRGQEEATKTPCGVRRGTGRGGPSGPPQAELPPGRAFWPRCPCPELPVGTRGRTVWGALQALPVSLSLPSLFQLLAASDVRAKEFAATYNLWRSLRHQSLEMLSLVLQGLVTLSQRPETVSGA